MHQESTRPLPDAPLSDPPECRALASALSCAMGRSRVLLQSDPELEVRVLVVLASADYKPYYIPLMNTIFSAEHLGVCIDCVNVSTHGSKFMQQACHQTGGTYQHLDGEPKRDRAGILQHMMCHFLPSRSLRSTLMGSASVQDVDLRASCFQDGSECDMGIVCSICLSIFRLGYFQSKKGKVKSCDVCKSFFKLRPRARPGKRRAKGQGKSGGGVSRTKRARDVGTTASTTSSAAGASKKMRQDGQ